MAETTQIRTHIEITPGTCGGKPRIAGHRIRVQDVAIWYEHLRMSPAEIIEQYPTITLADVHAALSYYYDHRDRILREIKEEEAFGEEMRRLYPSKLAGRLQGDGEDPLPSG